MNTLTSNWWVRAAAALAALAALTVAAMWSVGAFEPTRADRCYDAVMYYWDEAEFTPMEYSGAYEGLEPEEYEIYTTTREAQWDWKPSAEYVREQCEQVYG